MIMRMMVNERSYLMGIEQDILRKIQEGYYLNPEVIKFLLLENLTLKTLLHEKGLIALEEYKKCKEKCEIIFETKTGHQMAEQLKAMIQSSKESDKIL